MAKRVTVFACGRLAGWLGGSDVIELWACLHDWRMYARLHVRVPVRECVNKTAFEHDLDDGEFTTYTTERCHPRIPFAPVYMDGGYL